MPYRLSAFLWLAAVLAGAWPATTGTGSQTGDQTAPFQGLRLDGTLFDSAELAGGFVLLDFWGVWCPPCIGAFPKLSRLHDDYSERGFQVVGLAVLSGTPDSGDEQRGREIFFGKKAACASCHSIAGEGAKVGPDLTTIGKIRTGRDLLEAIAFPSASFARGFRSYVVLTAEGRVHTGIITRQTSDTVFLRTAQLEEVRIPQANIEEIRESSTSIMPKGLDKTLTRDEFRDLAAFLRGLK